MKDCSSIWFLRLEMSPLKMFKSISSNFLTLIDGPETFALMFILYMTWNFSWRSVFVFVPVELPKLMTTLSFIFIIWCRLWTCNYEMKKRDKDELSLTLCGLVLFWILWNLSKLHLLCSILWSIHRSQVFSCELRVSDLLLFCRHCCLTFIRIILCVFISAISRISVFGPIISSLLWILLPMILLWIFLLRNFYHFWGKNVSFDRFFNHFINFYFIFLFWS